MNQDNLNDIRNILEEKYCAIPSPEKSYTILSSARTGTNLIGFSMKDVNYGIALEGYNIYANKRFNWGFNTKNILLYTRDMINHQMSKETGVFGQKIFWDQFKYLQTESEKIPEIRDAALDSYDLLRLFFPHTRYIFLRRKDKVRQAISYVLADQSRIFCIKDNDTLTKAKMYQYIYNQEMIDYYLDLFLSQDLLWESFIESHNLHPLQIYYEDMVADFQETMHRIFDYVGLERIKISPKTKRQSTKVNDEWYERYLSQNEWIDINMPVKEFLAERVNKTLRKPFFNQKTGIRRYFSTISVCFDRLTKLVNNPGKYLNMKYIKYYLNKRKNR